MESVHEEIADASLDTGTNTLSSTAALSAKIVKITDLAFSYTGTVGGVRIEIKAGGITIYKTVANPTTAQIDRIANLGEIYLEAGEDIDMVITGATATDAAKLYIHGVEVPS